MCINAMKSRGRGVTNVNKIFRKESIKCLTSRDSRSGEAEFCKAEI